MDIKKEFIESKLLENWVVLDKNERNFIWDKFYEQFTFKPSMYQQDWPSFKINCQFVKYYISGIWSKNSSFEEFEFKYKDLHKKMLNAFIECTLENERIYALDWQHTCYSFNPRIKMDTINFEYVGGEKIEKWYVPILPNGDYYFFVARDLSWGALGHPWEKTMYIFGEKLIEAVGNNKPIIFNEVITINVN